MYKRVQSPWAFVSGSTKALTWLLGYINGSWKDTKSYQQLAWLAEDLASVNRTKTPWVFAMTHRPMYSSQVSSYQTNVRNAFEPLMLRYNVDAYFAGHIHWYERMYPLMANGTVDTASIVDAHTYKVSDQLSPASTSCSYSLVEPRCQYASSCKRASR